MAGSVVARLAQKYGAVIFFPTVAISTIYADWSHTQEWKQKQKEIAKAKELLKEL